MGKESEYFSEETGPDKIRLDDPNEPVRQAAFKKEIVGSNERRRRCRRLFREWFRPFRPEADLVGYESEDERMGRRNRSKRGTPYSKGDIREQYCINNKEVQVLESGSPSALFGCLSKHSESSCSSRHTFLSVCVGRAPSDENLHELCRQPLPRRPVDDLERAYMRHRPKSICAVDPSRYAWIPEDEESLNPELGRPIRPEFESFGMRRGHAMSFSSEHLSCPAHYLPPPPPPPAGSSRTKHVSFARSHTLTAFDDAMIELRRTPSGMFKSQERLILSTQQPRKTPTLLHISQEQRVVKKAAMKAQATQTGFLGREPPTYLSLSPRTNHRVKMVSQEAQTNGQLWNGRRLMKSYSEACYNFGVDAEAAEKNKEHDALTRTQSEEPRSPYMKQTMMPPWPQTNQGGGTSVKIEDRKKPRTARPYKEIFIDFEPVEYEKRSRQSYSRSDGDFLSEQSMDIEIADEPVVDRVDGVKVSLSSYSTVEEDESMNRELSPEKRHSFPLAQDSVDEEFHENLVYGGIFKKYSLSDRSLDNVPNVDGNCKSGPDSPDHRDSLLQMATLTVSRRTSPFASSDSLANDQKGDHSDGIWNESQSTVLHAESDNGEISSRTPSKKHLLLLQHQQRSSIDTEILEDDLLHNQSPLYSPLKQESTVPFVTIATAHLYESPSSVTKAEMTQQQERKSLGIGLLPAYQLSASIREIRRKMSKSPEKDEIRGATDISETSTTEGDYATAYDNSGTDTSSRMSAKQQNQSIGSKPGSKEGSSFDSASSMHSFAREDTVQAVPSSPPPIAEENSSDIAETEDVSRNELGKNFGEKTDEKEEGSGSGESSSSGSYSVDSGQLKPEWTEQERKRIRKGFKLNLSDHSNDQETWSEGEMATVKTDEAATSLRSVTQIKGKHTTVPSRRVAVQVQQKKWGTIGSGEITPKMVRSPAMPEGFRSEDWVPLQRQSSQTPEEVPVPKNEQEASSDESSCEFKITGIEDTINGHSPRRQRRRGAGRDRRNHGCDNGPRRRPLAQLPVNHQQLSPSALKYCRSPGHSPRGSPRKGTKGTKTQEQKKNPESPDKAGHLKALSAESLRSVSPGSDSVFYNEGEGHVVCHRCGREVEGEGAQKSEIDASAREIVQPPAGFADSPENTRGKSHRYYKKQEKRFRSEERGERRRHPRFRAEGSRAKSEERGKEKASRTKLRPQARSIDASMEKLRGADSSPSMSEPLTTEEPRVYSESYKKSSWICIVEGETSHGFRFAEAEEEALAEAKKESSDSTSSEKEFKRKYQAATHRMVHRKSSMEMYRRLQSKSFGALGFNLREQLEELLRLMLVVWCTQMKALVALRAECDKKVVVRRKSGEFGFRIHGSRPVVVSAIEPDTPAETSGLEVGDIVLSVNGVSVLEASHSDVVKLAHAGSDTLELDIARTNEILAPAAKEGNTVLCSGFLHKRGEDGKWHQRWFALKNDNCIYYYKSQAVTGQPLGALMLFDYRFNQTKDSDRPYSFRLEKSGARCLDLAAVGDEAFHKWKAHLETAMKSDPVTKNQWFERSCHFLYQPASAVPQPDCFGHLTQLEDKWRRRYCVLKDAALLLYTDSSASRALAVAFLQGYRVQSSGATGKRFSFEVIPPESKQKHFYFYTDTEMDKKRWIAAIEYSIDRWMQVG